jgi:hypothetical protein
MKRKKAFNRPFVGPAPLDENDPELQRQPFSVTDLVCEHANRISIGDPLGNPSTTPAQRELVILAGGTVATIERELELLKNDAVEGKVWAIEALHQIAFESARQLTSLADSSVEGLRSLAEHESVWPVLYGKQPYFREALQALVDGINLGAKAQALDPANVLSENTLQRQLLLVLIQAMERIRIEAASQRTKRKELADAEKFLAKQGLRMPKKLRDHYAYEDLKAVALLPGDELALSLLLKVEQPLRNPSTLANFISHSAGLPELTRSKESLAAWMGIVWEFIMNACEGHPENSRLRSLGTSRANSEPRSYERAVRQGIRVRIKNALAVIAKPL